MTPRRPMPLLAVVLALAGCAGNDRAGAPSPTSPPSAESPSSAAARSTPSGQRIEVTVTGGQVSGDTGRIPVAAGEEVTLVVTSDVADEIHLHGYDLTTPLTPGTPAELSFEAGVPGVFEVELHGAGTVLLTLQVG